MALITWEDSLSVGVAEIDQQHQQLISLINQLYDAMKQGKGKDVAGKIIDSLIDYTVVHFQTEEKYFEQFGYPETESHKQQHAAFVQQVSDFKEGFVKGKIALSIDMMNFLSEWLQKHIKGSDQQYTQFFQANGLS